MFLRNKLKKLRLKKGLTQAEIASGLNLTRSAYGHYETGYSEPSVHTIQKIAEFFNVSSDFFLDEKINSEYENIFSDDEILLIQLYRELPLEMKSEIKGEIRGYLKAKNQQTDSSDLHIEKRAI